MRDDAVGDARVSEGTLGDFIDGLKSRPALLLIFAIFAVSIAYIVSVATRPNATNLLIYPCVITVAALAAALIAIRTDRPATVSEATGDAQIDSHIANIRSGFVRARELNVSAFQETVSKYISLLGAEAEAWKNGRLETQGRLYDSILPKLYGAAEDEVFSTSVREYLQTWETPLGRALLDAHRRNTAARSTRVFIFKRAIQVDAEASRIMREHAAHNVDVRVFVDERSALDDPGDFTFVDKIIVGETVRFGDEPGARWYFRNDAINNKYQIRKRDLVASSVRLEDFVR